MTPEEKSWRELPSCRFRDPRLEWKAQTNGAFYASVGNLEHVGGHGCEYRLSIRTLSPDWSANCPSSSITLAAGETNDVKFTVTRLRGFTPKLTASFEALPKGLHAEPVEVSAQAGESTLRLIGEPDATPTQGPVRIVISEADALDRRARSHLA